jgi:hypothetical protein
LILSPGLLGTAVECPSAVTVVPTGAFFQANMAKMLTTASHVFAVVGDRAELAAVRDKAIEFGIFKPPFVVFASFLYLSFLLWFPNTALLFRSYAWLFFESVLSEDFFATDNIFLADPYLSTTLTPNIRSSPTIVANQALYNLATTELFGTNTTAHPPLCVVLWSTFERVAAFQPPPWRYLDMVQSDRGVVARVSYNVTNHVGEIVYLIAMGKLSIHGAYPSYIADRRKVLNLAVGYQTPPVSGLYSTSAVVRCFGVAVVVWGFLLFFFFTPVVLHFLTKNQNL